MITIQVPDEHEANMSAFLEGFSDAWWAEKGADFIVDLPKKQRHATSQAAYAAGHALYLSRISYLTRGVNQKIAAEGFGNSDALVNG